MPLMTPTVFPVLRYTDARAAIDWLIQAFGFQKVSEFEGPNGTVAHAEVRFGPSTIGISSATPPVPDNPWSHVKQGIYVCTEDIDAHYELAKRNGAEIAVSIRDMDYGSREYSARDTEGNLWSFGTYAMGRGEGQPTLFPEIHYMDPQRALAFLTGAFGFTKTLEVPAEGGGVTHAELTLGDGVVFLGTIPQEGEWKGLREVVCVYVDDVDRHHRRATAGGAVAKPPQNTPFGARQYATRDPEGFTWLFGTYRPN
jgi:uncharacterized glyoxalase superfamily protein PhnB